MGQILRVMAEDEQIKMAVITAPDMVEAARKIHGLSPTACAALGRLMLGASLLVLVLTFLWSLLLIIPGIVKAYSYALTPYLVHDHPEMSEYDCLKRSQQLMKGYKWKLFLLDLSFIGWALLAAIPYIGYAVSIWTIPY